MTADELDITAVETPRALSQSDFTNTLKRVTALEKVAELARDAVEAGAIDEIYLSLLRDALAEVD